MTHAATALGEARGKQVETTMSPARAEKLFAGTPATFQQLLDLVDAGKPLPHFALPLRVRATTAIERAEVMSQNVAGVLRGSDPQRRNEYVVISAHLDHLGIGEPIDGDKVY